MTRKIGVIVEIVGFSLCCYMLMNYNASEVTGFDVHIRVRHKEVAFKSA